MTNWLIIYSLFYFFLSNTYLIFKKNNKAMPYFPMPICLFWNFQKIIYEKPTNLLQNGLFEFLVIDSEGKIQIKILNYIVILVTCV